LYGAQYQRDPAESEALRSFSVKLALAFALHIHTQNNASRLSFYDHY